MTLLRKMLLLVWRDINPDVAEGTQDMLNTCRWGGRLWEAHLCHCYHSTAFAEGLLSEERGLLWAAAISWGTPRRRWGNPSFLRDGSASPFPPFPCVPFDACLGVPRSSHNVSSRTFALWDPQVCSWPAGDELPLWEPPGPPLLHRPPCGHLHKATKPAPFRPAAPQRRLIGARLRAGERAGGRCRRRAGGGRRRRPRTTLPGRLCRRRPGGGCRVP